MSTVNAFTPKGKTYLVSTSDVQVITQDNVISVSYRVVNLASATVYLGFKAADPTGAAVSVGTVAAPTAGSPVNNTIGFLAGSIEVVSLPPNVWLKADTATSLLITPGEGI
jgi:hypothetical protein